MLTRWLLASLHLLALPLGLGAVWARGRALKATRTLADVPRVMSADNLWGLAAVLWVVTGLVRLLEGTEKPSQYYFGNWVFYVKMALFVLILALEGWPMTVLIRWRIALVRGRPIDLAIAPTLARICALEAGLTVLMVFAATAMARGLFY